MTEEDASATRRTGEPASMPRRDRPAAVKLDPEADDHLVNAADNALDRAELDAAREEDDFIPWDQVKVHLGLP